MRKYPFIIGDRDIGDVNADNVMPASDNRANGRLGLASDWPMRGQEILVTPGGK